MYNRTRDEQEARNTAEVMIWIEYLARLPDSTIDLDLVCHINRPTLRRTDRDYWAGRVRAEVDWQRPDEWSRQRAIVALDERGLAVADKRTGKLLVRFPPDREVGPMLEQLLTWIGSPAAAALHPVVRAGLFHQQFTAIHPFRHGNGRTARAIVILLLWQSGFPTEILALQRVLDERRDAYVAALRAADQGNIQEWVRFIVNAVVDALQTEMQLI